MKPTFLQLTTPETTEAVKETAEVVTSVETISVMQLIIDGGWPMIPLTLLFIWAIYIFFERTFAINNAAKTDPNFIENVKNAVKDGDINKANSLCDSYETPVAVMIKKGVSRLGKPLKDIQASIENTGRLEVFKLEKSMSMLATIAGAAPMIGFLGTVLGMIATFHEMYQSGGQVEIDQMAGGIMQALVTTVAGLIVGIIAYIGYNTLVARVDKEVHKMEASTLDFLDLLNQPA